VVVVRTGAGLGGFALGVGQPLLAGSGVGDPRQALDLMRAEGGQALLPDGSGKMGADDDLSFGNGSRPTTSNPPPLTAELRTPGLHPGLGGGSGFLLEHGVERGRRVPVQLVPTLVACPFRQIALGTFGSGGWRPGVPGCLPSNEEPSGSEGRALGSNPRLRRPRELTRPSMVPSESLTWPGIPLRASSPMQKPFEDSDFGHFAVFELVSPG